MQWKTSRPPFPLASPPLQGLQGGHNPHPHPPGQLERLTSDLLTTHIWGQADWWLFRAESACDYLAGRALSCSVRVPPWGREDVNWRERERERKRVISNTMGDNRRASILDILRGRNKENKRDQPASSERWVLLLIVNFSFRVALSRWLSLSSVVQLSLISSMLDILFLNSLDF